MDDIHYNRYDSISKIGLKVILDHTKEMIEYLKGSNTPLAPHLSKHYNEKLEILEAMYQEKFEEE